MRTRTLTEGECHDLLANELLGRVALSIDSLPAIVPVDYALADDTIVCSTLGDTRAAQATIGNVVAFEVDRHDAEGSLCWSVSLIGRGEQLDGAVVSSLMERNSQIPDLWASTEKPQPLIQIRITKLSGQVVVG